MDITLSFPDNVNLLLKSNQEVDFDTVIYETVEINEVNIPLSKKLNIKPNQIFKYLRKFVGEEIVKEEILAIKKTVFNDIKYLSEFTGIVKEINHETGDVIIQIKNDSYTENKSFFKGTIKDAKNNQITLVIHSDAKQFPLKKTENNFGGEIYYLKDQKDNLTESQIKNKIIFCEIINPYLQTKLETLGASGFLTLKNLPAKSELPNAQIKNIDDFSKIFDYNLKYCLIVQKENIIYLYN